MGPYTCLVPPLYLYSIGDVFRAGAEGTYRRSKLLIFGYLLISISYACWVLFPIGLFVVFVYWQKLWKNLPSYEVRQSEGT